MIFESGFDLALLFYFSVYGLFLFWLASRFVGTGSDHYFAFYHIDLIRKSGGFIRNYPNILNETATVDTQLTFTILSWFNRKYLGLVSLLLNPLVMLTLFGLFVGMLFDELNALGKLAADSSWTLWTVIVMTLTPQYFMGNNARIYGLTMRGLGLLSVMGLALSIYVTTSSLDGFNPIAFSIAIASVYLTWHVNLFAQQTMILVGLFLGFVFGEWVWAGAVLAGTALFVLLQPSYAFFFFRMRYEYFIIFYKHLSAKLIWDKRPSLWGDLMSDLWKRRGRSWRHYLYYIYTHPFVAVAFCNPLMWFGLLKPPTLMEASPLILYSYHLGIASCLAMFVTSFRKTRCLGEPERYVEMAIPFTNLVGALSLVELFGPRALVIVAFVFAVMNALQIFMFVKMATYAKANTKNVFNFPRQSPGLIKTLENFAAGDEIRFISNNGDWTKILVNDRWKFVLFYPTVRDIAGISIGDFLKTFPVFEKKHLEHFIDRYSINYCLLDKREYSLLFQGDKTKTLEVVDENEVWILYRIQSRLQSAPEMSESVVQG